jgi:ankyrin repeat protein
MTTCSSPYHATLIAMASKGEYVSHRAIAVGCPHAVELSIKNGEPINNANWGKNQLIHEAAFEGDISILEILKSNGKEKLELDCVNNTGTTPLYCAAMNNHPDAIEWLILEGSKATNTATYYDTTPLSVAVKNENEEAIRMLVRYDDTLMNHVYKIGMTIMHIAAITSSNMVDLLVELGCNNINHADYQGQTPLYYAAKDGKIEEFKTLLRHGAKLDAKDRYGFTALHQAVIFDRVAIIETILLTDKRMCTLVNDVGWTAMHFAIHCAKTIELIARFDCLVVNSQDKYGRTPLDSMFLRSPITREPLLSLVALGDQLTAYKELCLAKNQTPIEFTEEEIADVRYRVYFADSLVFKLLFIEQSWQKS